MSQATDTAGGVTKLSSLCLALHRLHTKVSHSGSESAVVLQCLMLLAAFLTPLGRGFSDFFSPFGRDFRDFFTPLGVDK